MVVNTELEHKPYIEEENIFNFICYDLDSLKQMLTVSDARIYVTRSYLYFNRWSINSFAKNIDVSIDRIRLINDDPSVIK